jgi:hypothetical protein
MSRFGSGQTRVSRSRNINEIRGVRDTELYPIIVGQDTNPKRNRIRRIEHKDNLQKLIDALPNVIDILQNKKMIEEMKKIITNNTRQKSSRITDEPMVMPEEKKSSRITDEPMVMPEEIKTSEQDDTTDPSIIDNMVELYDIATKAYSVGKDIYDIYKTFISISGMVGAMSLMGGSLKRQITNDGSEISIDDYYNTPIYVNNNNRFKTYTYPHLNPTELQLAMRDKRNVLDITDNRRRG